MVFDTADVNWMSLQGILDKVIVSAKTTHIHDA